MNNIFHVCFLGSDYYGETSNVEWQQPLFLVTSSSSSGKTVITNEQGLLSNIDTSQLNGFVMVEAPTSVVFRKLSVLQ